LGIHQAKVILALCIDASGNLSSSHVVEDPGWGFGGAARQCVAKMRFQPGLDASGNPAMGRFDLSVRYVR
jgi:hypothetical protein